MMIYYAVFNLADAGINVIFPDLNNATTFSQDMHEALHTAKDLLASWLIDTEDDKTIFLLPLFTIAFH